MKKTMVALILGLMTLSGAFAANEAGYLGAGFVTGLSAQGNISLVDNTKINVFLGSGTKFLGPLPIYAGWEALVGFQNIGESSTVSTYYELELIRLGKFNYLGVITAGTQELKLSFWDIDLSPRGMVTLDLGPLAASAYAGFNYNFINMHSTFTDSGNPNRNEEKDEVLSVSPLQVLTGVRLSAFFLYLEYTRYFDIVQGNVSWQKIAENRVSLGGILKF